jgi:hypothetical protein
VIVSGSTLKNQARALNKQKNNANITNVISSDQIGCFPDANIGDALKRVPELRYRMIRVKRETLLSEVLLPTLTLLP